LRDARSIFQITSTSGAPGSLEINAPEQDISAAVAELEVALLDATALIQDRCAIRPEDASSLVISGQDAVAERHDSSLFSNHLTGSETQGHPDAPNRQGARGQEPVDWLAQTGGFECRQTPCRATIIWVG